MTATTTQRHRGNGRAGPAADLYDHPLEARVVGNAILSREMLRYALANLSPDVIVSDKHRALFAALRELDASTPDGEQIDGLSLARRAAEHLELPEADVLECIANLVGPIGMGTAVPSMTLPVFHRAVSDLNKLYFLRGAGHTIWNCGEAIRVGNDSIGAIRKTKAALEGLDLDAVRITRSRPVLTTLDTIAGQAVAWLWDFRIAIASLTVIFGPPGKGKSFVVHDLAARVSAGRRWPPNTTGTSDPAGVILLSCEDDPSRVLRPRLELANADLRNITLLRGVRTPESESEFFDLSQHLPELRQAIESLPNVRLVIVDPLAPYLGADTNSNRHGDVYNVLAPLAALAEETETAIVCVHHCNKSRDATALGRGMGSVAFSAIPRNTWFVSSDRDDESRRLLLHGKASLGPPQPGLAFSIDLPGVLCWHAELVAESADQHFQAEARVGSDDDRGAVDAAADWLREQLEGGPRSSRELEQQGTAEGHSRSTLLRARKTLGLKAWPQRGEGGRIGDWLVGLRREGASQ